MSAPVTNFIASVLEGLADLTRGLSRFGEGIIDFAFVRITGLPFVVLGYRQTGKTTLLEYLRRNPAIFHDWDPDPTAAGGDPVRPFNARFDGDAVRVRPKRDVGGEYAMWETDWVDLFQQNKPRGIIFMIDHTRPYQHKDALNFILNLMEDERITRKQVRTFLLIVNKSDLWDESQTLVDLLDEYKNETRRLKSQSERLGYTYAVRQTSLLTGEGVDEAMGEFFSSIRPKGRRMEAFQRQD